GFEIVESTGCVDKANYSEDIGAEICLNKIKDKIWYLLGFLLQTAFEGVK
ncbi:MAG: Gp49 family protein, partial [Clostridioides difficile]|nr:Gp49 family protein [Clostridioides difficile]